MMLPAKVKKAFADLRQGTCTREDGQIVVMVGLFALVMFGITGLAVDVGRMYVMKAELSRALDSAALAGAESLTISDPTGAEAKAACEAYLAANEPDIIPGTHCVPTVNSDEKKLTVKATKKINFFFIDVLPGAAKNGAVGANAVAVYGNSVVVSGTTVPGTTPTAIPGGGDEIVIDAYIGIDASGSMHDNCNSLETTNDGTCPIHEARDGAITFLNVMLGNSPNGTTQVGVGAARGCFNPPLGNPDDTGAYVPLPRFGTPEPGLSDQPASALMAQQPNPIISLPLSFAGGSESMDLSAAPAAPSTKTPTRTPTKTATRTPVKTSTPIAATATKTATRTSTPVPSTPTISPTRTATPYATPNYTSANPCIRSETAPTNPQVTYLSSDKDALTSKIGNIRAIGATGEASSGSGTNPCGSLKKAQDILFGPGHHTSTKTKRYVVLLTDGDSVYNAGVAYSSYQNSPDPLCRPTSATTSDGALGSACRNDTQTQEGKVDTLTYNLAESLKAQGVDIYVIALSVCGPDTSPTLCDSSIIGLTGASYPDRKADNNLLKCVASSTPGTNDHFEPTSNPGDLEKIFEKIAKRIVPPHLIQ